MADDKEKKGKMVGGSEAGGAVYCMGIIGSLVYFIQNAETIGQGLIGVFKALFWPAFLVYKALEALKV